MKPLRIAFVVPIFPVTTETFIVNQIDILLEKGHIVKVLAFSEGQRSVHNPLHEKHNLTSRVTYYKDLPIKWTRYLYFLRYIKRNIKDINFRRIIRLFNYFKYGKKSYSLRYYLKFKWFLDEGPFDIIHIHFGTIAPYIVEMKNFGFIEKSRIVISFHGYDISPRFLFDYKLLGKKLFSEIDLITVNSPYTGSILQGFIPENKIEYLPVGLDLNLFKKKNQISESTFNILFVGRLIEFKAPTLVVEIINKLILRGNPQLKTIIVGEGKERFEIEKRIEKYGLQDKVFLTGSISQIEIIKIMETADVFLFPGIYDTEGRAETQGLVLQEAQAMNLPVIISNVGGMKYGIVDGETGYVVQENDIDGFVEKIERLMHDEDLRKRMGKKGREYVQQHFSSQLLGERLIEKYYNLILSPSKK